MFHLDEYVNLPQTHPASFRKYLKEHFIAPMGVGKAHFVDGTAEGIAALTEEIKKAPIDVGLIGIGRNAHIAFNDPPADFDTKASYLVVNLDEACRNQQVGGWFARVEEVPKQAVSMSVPIRYNYDKPENPVFMVVEGLKPAFSSFSKREMGSQKSS